MFLILIFLSFKKAARGGGVYPDVMFEVAKHWYELYNKNLPAGNAMATPPPGNLFNDIDNFIKDNIAIESDERRSETQVDLEADDVLKQFLNWIR